MSEPASPMEERTRPTDYGDDVTRTESHAVATGYDPATGARLKRALRVLLIVLLVGFLAVRVARFFHSREMPFLLSYRSAI